MRRLRTLRPGSLPSVIDSSPSQTRGWLALFKLLFKLLLFKLVFKLLLLLFKLFKLLLFCLCCHVCCAFVVVFSSCHWHAMLLVFTCWLFGRCFFGAFCASGR